MKRFLKGTHMVITHSNKTHLLTKAMCTDIWVVVTLNQLFHCTKNEIFRYGFF